MSDDFLRNFRVSMPAVDNLARTMRAQEQANADMMASIDEANMEKSERRRRNDEHTQRMLELTDATSRATAELALIAAAQERESQRLGLLTWILSIAVIFDIVQGSFNDHTPATATLAIAISAAVVISARYLGTLGLRVRG